MAFAVGENVGAYRIVAQLGQGGMATVFKAYHPRLDRFVAIKVLHPAFKEDTTFVERFNREARIVARLEHPNVVPIYDFAEHRGLAYLVMQFIEGETLKARLKRGRLTWDQMGAIALRVGAALDCAHLQGILHRDVKPSNILLAGDTSDGRLPDQVYLADFGLARIAEAGESTLSRDMMMGTPQYISPEQARGDRDLDAGTDVYSLGVVLFELVTGRVPFSADTPYSIIHDHIFSPLPLPTSINPDLPPAVEQVLLKALAKERGARYADAGSLTAAFSAALHESSPPPQDAATVVRPEPRPEGATPPARLAPVSASRKTAPSPRREGGSVKRSPVWILLIATAALLFLCLLGALAWNGAVRDRRAKATATAMAATTTAQSAALDPELAARVAELEAAVKDGPDDAQARTDLAFAYLEAGEVQAARQQMRQAVGLHPQDEQVYLRIGRYWETERDLRSAAEVYALGVQTLPDSRALKVNLGLALWQLGSPEGEPLYAEELARDIMETMPDDPTLHALVARTLISQGKMPEARAEIDRALELAPRSAEVRLVSALWLRKDGQRVAARRELQFALELGAGEEWLRLEIKREIDSLGPAD